MIYTETGKYAIRALIYLAGKSVASGTVTSGEIAAAEGIPPYYLAKVLKDLGNAGILDSLRGRGGGFRLRRPASEVTVFEVLEAAEGLSARTEVCVLGVDECNEAAPCALHDTWTEFREHTLARLHELTLADLQQDRQMKRAANA